MCVGLYVCAAQVWYYMSQVVDKPGKAPRVRGGKQDDDKEGEPEVAPILKKRAGVPFYWMCSCPRGKNWRQLNIMACKTCKMHRPCDEGGNPKPAEKQGHGVAPCAKAGCTNKLRLHDKFCSKCGSVAPASLADAAAGLGPRVWEDNAPLDPSWDRTWRRNPVKRDDDLWYYGSVTTEPDKPDGLVALYCIVLAAPNEKYESKNISYKMPWWKCMVEVFDMRVSIEVAVDFKVKGVTPLPELARAMDGGTCFPAHLPTYFPTYLLAGLLSCSLTYLFSYLLTYLLACFAPMYHGG